MENERTSETTEGTEKCSVFSKYFPFGGVPGRINAFIL
jgi:hypothetical protein